MSDTFEKIISTLPPKKARFVQQYLIHGVGAQAAREAGYSPQENAAKAAAWRLLKRDKGVMAAVEAAHASLAKKTLYDSEKAMEELNAAAEFARETKNATALANIMLTKLKLHGLLIERQDVRQLGGFQIQIVGIDDV